jgi:hypothetical protein
LTGAVGGPLLFGPPGPSAVLRHDPFQARGPPCRVLAPDVSRRPFRRFVRFDDAQDHPASLLADASLKRPPTCGMIELPRTNEVPRG